jgi:cell division protein FtsL
VVRKRKAATAADSIRRRRLLAFSVAAVSVACVLGLVVSHVALAQGQFELEKLQGKAAEEQAHYERLRLQVAQLESPSRVVAAAQERLGMVPPPGVTYLSPTGPVSGLPAADDETDTGQESATEDWSSVKRQLTRR